MMYYESCYISKSKNFNMHQLQLTLQNMENQALVTLVVVLIIVDGPTCMKRMCTIFMETKDMGPNII
jgi:hypothetical protein